MSENVEPKGPSQHKSQTRSDALANQERLLAAAVTAMLREGRQVPMAAIARDAGVGIATLYRNYPTREALLEALTARSFELVLEVVEETAARELPAIGALESFLTSTIAHREQLVLPLHGGPDDLSEESLRLRKEIHNGIARILERGGNDLTVRTDITAQDLVFFGAMLAQPLSTDDDWLEANLLRQKQVFLAGLAPTPPALDAI